MSDIFKCYGLTKYSQYHLQFLIIVNALQKP